MAYLKKFMQKVIYQGRGLWPGPKGGRPQRGQGGQRGQRLGGGKNGGNIGSGPRFGPG